MIDYTITIEEVQALVPSASPGLVGEFITLVSAADPCLDGQGITSVAGKSAKRLAVAHMSQLTLNGGRGNVTSEKAPSGAARSFSAWGGGSKGLSATPFGSMLMGLDYSGCVVGLFDADGASGGPRLFIGTAGT